MIIIGSKALYANDKNLITKERLDKSDFDVIMSFEDFNTWYNQFKDIIVELIPKHATKYRAKLLINGSKKMFEIELREEEKSTSFLLDNISSVSNSIYVDPLGITWNALKLEYLALTKKSHLYFPVHFDKSIEDYHLLKDKLGDFKKDKLMEKYFQLRSKESKIKFADKYSTPKLNITNDDFFKVSGVSEGRVYVHDDLHYVIKHFDKPIYEMMKKEENLHMAWCEKDLFNELSLDKRIKCVQEESYVIALERYIIPKIGSFDDYFWCYKRALMRVCTTLCSGFFREFAIEHHKQILEQYNSEFVDKFNKAVINKTLTPIKKAA